MSGVAWQQRPYGPNQVVLPLDDAVEHSFTERCVCKPRWFAAMDEGAVVWTFIHSAIDGRQQIQVTRQTL